MTKERTVVVVVGFISGPEGEAALEHAVAEVRGGGDLLLVVNASAGDALVDRRFLQGDRLAELRTALGSTGVPHEVVQPVRGRSPADEIVSAAEERHARLVVVGFRRRSPVGKLLLGSTSQQVLLDAPCDVLAVKAGQRTRAG